MTPLRAVTPLLLVVPLLLAPGCRRETAAPAPAPEPAVVSEPLPAPTDTETAPEASDPGEPAEGELEVRFGTALGTDGTVRERVRSFGVGDPICLAVRLPGGSAGGRLEATLTDLDGNPHATLEATLAGDPPAAVGCFAGVGSLGRAAYRVSFGVDGSPVGVASFVITDERESEDSGGV
jgi:hypothetical protein